MFSAWDMGVFPVDYDSKIPVGSKIELYSVGSYMYGARDTSERL